MQISELPIVMIRSLLITLLIEVVIAYILKYRKFDLIYVLLVNIITNPLLNSLIVYINYNYGLKFRNIFLFIFEIWALIIEGFIYSKCLNNKKYNGYILSLILNLLSFFCGLIINSIIY